MSILKRFRKQLDTLAQASMSGLGAEDDRLSFSAEIPAGVFGSILKLNVVMDSEAHGDGERVRMRAHVQTNFASVLRPMLDAPPPPKKARGKSAKKSSSRAVATTQFFGQVAGRGMRRAMSNPLVQRLAEPLLKHDINSWIEVAASTASLDRGANDLMPKSEKLAALGIRPAQHAGPHMESWSGALAGGSAQVSTFLLDKNSLPKRLRKKLGDQPFNLAAMIINTVEEK